MASTPIPEPAPSPEIADRLDSIFSTSEPAEAPTESTPGPSAESAEPMSLESPEPEPPAEPADPSQPPAETGEPGEPPDEVAEQPTPQEPEQELQLDDPDAPITEPDFKSDDGKTFHFRKSKAVRLLQSDATLREIQDSIPGATPDSLQQNYRTSVVFDEMATDFESGEPQRVQKFLDFWIGHEANRNGVAAMAAELPGYLARTNPEALVEIKRQTYLDLIANLEQKYLQSGKDQDLALLQNLSAALYNGRFPTRDEVERRRTDAVANERAQLNRERQEFQEQQRRVQADRQRNFEATLDNASADAVREAIDTAIAPVKQHYEQVPEFKDVLRRIENELRQRVDEAINANPDWKRQFENRRVAAARRPSDQAVSDLAAMKRGFAERVIRRHLRETVNTYTTVLVNRSQGAHASKQAAQARKEPPPTAATTQRGKPSISARIRSGEIKDHEDAFKAIGW